MKAEEVMETGGGERSEGGEVWAVETGGRVEAVDRGEVGSEDEGDEGAGGRRGEDEEEGGVLGWFDILLVRDIARLDEMARRETKEG